MDIEDHIIPYIAKGSIYKKVVEGSMPNNTLNADLLSDIKITSDVTVTNGVSLYKDMDKYFSNIEHENILANFLILDNIAKDGFIEAYTNLFTVHKNIHSLAEAVTKLGNTELVNHISSDIKEFIYYVIGDNFVLTVDNILSNLPIIKVNLTTNGILKLEEYFSLLENDYKVYKDNRGMKFTPIGKRGLYIPTAITVIKIPTFKGVGINTIADKLNMLIMKHNVKRLAILGHNNVLYKVYRDINSKYIAVKIN